MNFLHKESIYIPYNPYPHIYFVCVCGGGGGGAEG